MQSTQPVDAPTPRTDALKPEGAYHNWSIDQLFKHSRQLERELIAATAELERTKADLVQEKLDFLQAVANAGPCGACAEIIACGSTMHEHKDCVHAELARTKEQLRVARKALIRIKQCDFDSYTFKIAKTALDTFTQPQSGAVDPVKGEEG